MASNTTLTAVAYKRWPASVPATKTPTSFTAVAQDIDSLSATLVAEGSLTTDNYDDQSVVMYGEAVSPFDADYPTKGVLIETVWRPRTAGGGGSGNLSVSRTASSVTVVNSAGDDAVLPAANTSQAGVLSASDKLKLDGIETGAQVNQTATAIVAAIDAELGQSNWQSGTPFYDALALGLVADGVTNDTANINNIIAAVNAAGGGRVILPPNAVIVTNGNHNLLSGVHLIGQGDSTVFYVPNTVGFTTTVFKTGGVSQISDASLADFKIQVQSGGAFTANGVNIVNATRCVVSGILVDGAASGVAVETFTYGRVTDNRVVNGTDQGFIFSTGTQYVEIARNVDTASAAAAFSSSAISDCAIHDNLSTGSADNAFDLVGTRLAIYGNTAITVAALGMVLNLTHASVYDNRIVDCQQEGVYITGDGVDVHGNVVSNVGLGASNTYDAIRLNDITNSLVHDNIVATGGFERYLIVEGGSSSGNSVYDNILDGTGVTGDYLIGGTDSNLRRPDVESALGGVHVGTTVGKVGLSVASNGTVVTATLFGPGAGQDFQVVFSDEVKTFSGSTTTATLTAGTNTAPQVNYVYFLESTKAVAVSTAGWPAAAYVPFATVLVQSASNVQTDGPLGYTLVAQAASGIGFSGGLTDVTQWLREQPPRWITGGAITPTVTTNGGGPDDIDIATTAATLLRRERITFPSRDTGATDSIYIYNHSTTPFNKVGTLGTVLQTTSGGGSIADGQFVSVVIWGAASETTTVAKLYANLPSGFYTLQTEAQCDAKRYTSYTIPDELKNAAFLIARMVFKYEAAASGTWTHIATYDLRGRAIDSTRDGNPPFSREFLDTEFKVRDNADTTKAVRFELSSVATATERTMTVPNASGTLTLLEVAQSFAAGAKKTFSHSATTAGVNIAPVAGDPSSPADGDVWYNSTLNKLRKRENGVTTDLDTQGSASPLGNDNDFQYNNGGAFGGASGLVYNEAQARPYVANGIEFGEVATPATPSTNRSLLYGRDVATLTRPYFMTSLGLPFEFAIAQSGDRQIGYWWALPESSTVNNGYRLNYSNHGSGTLATYTPTAADAYSKYARVRASTSTASNITAGLRCGTKWMMLTHGFFVRLRFGIHTPATGWSGFAGLTSSAAALSGGADPSSYTNIIGVGWDTADTNLYMMHNDGTGTATKVDLGANFPTGNTAQDVYDLILYCPSSGAAVDYRIERIEGGSNQVATGTLSSDLPSTSLALGFQLFASNRSSATAINFDIMGSYWETPF